MAETHLFFLYNFFFFLYAAKANEGKDGIIS